MGEFDSAVLAGQSEGMTCQRRFTSEQANHSLVLVSKIVKDILGLYCRGKVLEERYASLDRETDREERREIKQQYEGLLKTLQGYNQELSEIGCCLRDWQTGTIDWPSMHDGREVYLCWRMGEENVAYYHEAHESFAARKRLADKTEQPA